MEGIAMALEKTGRIDQSDRRAKARRLTDEDDTLPEVGEDHDFEFEDETDPLDRRRDPLRQPH
jgi:hypothetical protein